MLEHILHEYLPILITIIEIIGIFVVTSGAIKAFIDYIKCSFMKCNVTEIRFTLGTAMVTGLEFKMAAEILRTVIVRSKEEIFLLGSIIVLREILFYFIKKDMEEHHSADRKKVTGIKIERE